MLLSSARVRGFGALGFDLDHALCRYKLLPFFDLVHDAVGDFLVKERGFPAEAVRRSRTREDEHAFCSKGLILEWETGNFLKLDSRGWVAKASHGTHMLNRNEIELIYAGEWTHAATMREMKKHDDFLALFTFFESPAAVLLARLVDAIDGAQGGAICPAHEKALARKEVGYGWIKGPLFEAFNNAFNAEQFAAKVGGYFPPIIDTPERYVYEAPETFTWLKDLRADGTRVILITNSQEDYASCLLRHMFGPSWQDAFDLVVTYAKKPGFFTDEPSEKPFYLLDAKSECVGQSAFIPKGHTVNTGKVVVGGTYRGLCEYLSSEHPRVPGKEGVAFFGDHMWGDLGATRKYTDWEPVAVVEELDYRSDESSPGPFLSKEWGHFLREDGAYYPFAAGEGAPTFYGGFLEEVSPLMVTSVSELAATPS